MSIHESQPAIYDVIVVGAGLAGNIAALSAAESGATVLLLEKGAQYGGSSVKSGGGMLFAGTDIQAAAGIEDDNEQLRASILAAGRGKNDPAPVQAYLEHQLDTFEFMRGHGIDFTLTITGTDVVSRMHAAPQGYATKVMHEKFVALDHTHYWPSSTARRLVQAAEGRVTGVVLERDGQEIVLHAAAVILTSGGFARSRELLETFAPQWADATKMGGVDNTGDGLRMAWALGADVADMGYVEASFGASIKNYPDLSEDPNEEPRLLYPNSQGAIIVNLDGKRFVDENLNYKTISSICVRQPAGIGFQVFDDWMMNRSQVAPTPADFKSALADGYVIVADTVEDLAEKLQIDPYMLRATINAYNGFVDEGVDPEFGRSLSDYGVARGGHLDTAPYYAFPCRSGLTTTFCGVRVDEQLNVVDVFGKPIPGLFAAGEVVGGFHGATYLSGTGLGKAGVFGRAAGLSSVAQLPRS
ncbi:MULTISPECIES: FAD-dependent oxidoreductase [Rhodococcus]|jgi:fumarate reductase flavoprotein subunit|uniref:FAD-binding protein n=1 Tax=Rhodococcus qingshengii JCM 15477 TaxID=1303681 RepID=A0AB38RM43_RHOSG|nr:MULTISPECIES: FAD-dependent oxidoreductase [Rhodococcus]MDA3635182.1 FAD-binding protein [Rhodococcus sp. C-2]UPU46472.1 FAD-binding protein [Rhodococcus qingshengii JCM 15477]SCC66797.1 fumarate reductase flavoprotein subunit [Rhodococcus qingshengii]